MTDNMNNEYIYKYFPHISIREGQEKIIYYLYGFFRNGNGYDGMILCAGTGLGKESCMTSQALLALDEGLFDKVIIIIPTDIGKKNILKELESVKHGRMVKKILSKEILCNWMKESTDERISAIEEEACAFYLCKLQGHKCKYKDHGCDYIMQKEEIMLADIIICDYNYILSSFIRRASGIEEIFQNNCTLLLVNEAHMLRRRSELIFTNSISSTTLNRAVAELDEYGFGKERDHVRHILRHMEKEALGNYRLLKSRMERSYDGLGEIILESEEIEEFLGEENMGATLVEIGEEISKLKFERKEGIISYAEIIGNFILRFYRLIKWHRDRAVFFLKLKNDLETKYIGWTPTDTRGFIKNAITYGHKFVLYSGTCKPTRLRNDAGLSFENVFTPEAIESPYLINRKDIILAKERFSYTNLKDESFVNRVIKDLDILFDKLEKPIGIVCTNKVYDSLGLSSKYTILNEPESQEEVEYWLDELVPKATLVRFTPFGRISQSIDISLKNIIFLGFPHQRFDSITEEKINKMQKNMKGTTGNRKAKAVYIEVIQPACERIVQSVMRSLRSENDRLHVIYYDVNFKLNKPGLGSKNLTVCTTLEEVLAILN